MSCQYMYVHESGHTTDLAKNISIQLFLFKIFLITFVFVIVLLVQLIDSHCVVVFISSLERHWKKLPFICADVALKYQ